MDERTAERLLYVDATLTEMAQLAMRGRTAYDSDVAVARACQYNVIRLAADLERLGEAWVEARPAVPWRLIKGMRNRIAHNYWTVETPPRTAKTGHGGDLVRSGCVRSDPGRYGWWPQMRPKVLPAP